MLRFSLCTCRRHYPGGAAGCPSFFFPSDDSFPWNKVRSASTSSFSRPAQRSLALQPAHSPSHLVTLSTGGFSRLVASPSAPIATGRNDPCREGLAPSQEPCLPRRTLCPRSPRGSGFLAPVVRSIISRELDASVEASGPHDFAVRFQRARLARQSVHRIPPPTSVTIAKRPSGGGGTAHHCHGF